MLKAVGVDPGSSSWDIVSLIDGKIDDELTVPTREVSKFPEDFLGKLEEISGDSDLVIAPSGYGLPIKMVEELSDGDIDELVLKEKGESSVMGLTKVVNLIKNAEIDAVVIPGVKHLSTVPKFRKINRIDMGTPDKICSTILGIESQSKRLGLSYDEVSLLMIEIGHAFSSVISVDRGQIVDGIGGSAGPTGMKSAGSYDAEIAYLIGNLRKLDIRKGGILAIAGVADIESLVESLRTGDRKSELAVLHLADEITRYLGGAMEVENFQPKEIIISGFVTKVEPLIRVLRERICTQIPLVTLEGDAKFASQASEGAAMLADGLIGGKYEEIVERLKLKEAHGSIYDFLPIMEDRDFGNLEKDC